MPLISTTIIPSQLLWGQARIDGVSPRHHATGSRTELPGGRNHARVIGGSVWPDRERKTQQYSVHDNTIDPGYSVDINKLP